MEKRFVSIYFPSLATDWFALRQPRLRQAAFVLTIASHGRMVITAVNPLAQSKGIYVGAMLADARALVPDLEAFDDKPNLTTQLLHRIAEWCIRFTPAAAVDPPFGIILDASGCSHLWGGDEQYACDSIKRIKARGYQTHLAIADTIGAAWAMARFGKGGPVVAINGHTEALLPLPVAALRLEVSLETHLNHLGLRQVKDVVGIPRRALHRRFGQHLLQRLSQAMGAEEEVVQAVQPVEPYQHRLPVPEPILRLKGIEIALHYLLEALCHRLRKEGKGLRAAYFRIYRANSTAQGIEIGTSRPSCNVQHLFNLFELKLSTLAPEPGIELFILGATKVEPHSPLQQPFWTTTSCLQNSALSELIDRLAGKVGPQNIHRFLPAEHHWPEWSFKKAASLDEQPASEWPTNRPRPLQLLESPEPIEVTAPVPDYPPMLFRYKGTLHKVMKADGPERIEQEWWIQEGDHRDYYAVEDEEGRRYWLFRSGHYHAEKPHRWFLHGFFA